MTNPQTSPAEPTPVDDVRRVRERLDQDAQGDIHALAEQSRAAVEQYRSRLGLKSVAAPSATARRAEKTA